MHLPLRVWVHCPRASNGLLPPRSYLPSSRTPLLGPSPLRTVLKTFAIYGSSPSNALLGRTRMASQWRAILPLRLRSHQQFALSSFALPQWSIRQTISCEAPNWKWARFRVR